MSEPILVSACLLGLLTRYDGAAKRSERVLDFLAENGLVPVPVCPEQLAGLPTPRPATRFEIGEGADVLDGSGRVVNDREEVVNGPFQKGARETLKLARLAGCRRALLKERSPSCGVNRIYRGLQVVEGSGVTAALLRREGLEIFSEEDLCP